MLLSVPCYERVLLGPYKNILQIQLDQAFQFHGWPNNTPSGFDRSIVLLGRTVLVDCARVPRVYWSQNVSKIRAS
jgi:hypothetical protein